jgi:carbonic anhydrase
VGGHTAPVINDILALDGFFGLTDILVVHHTDCGTTHFKDASIREGLFKRLPERRGEIEGMVFGGIEEYVDFFCFVKLFDLR